MNTLSITDISTVANEVLSMATGKNIDNITTGNFVSVANTALLQGYDPLIQAVSQTLSRTIFSIRPYYRKMPSLRVDSLKYGNHVRKVQMVDKADFETDQQLPLEDGKSVDMFVVKKPEVLQTNFYGLVSRQRHTTIFKNQLDTALSSLEEFSRFISMILTDGSNKFEQDQEAIARMTIANLVAGHVDAASDSVIHVLTEYNNQTGSALSPVSVNAPENFKDFAQWLYAFLNTMSAYLTDRTHMYHLNITGKPFARHTPYGDQRLYLNTAITNNLNARVLSDTFHSDRLAYGSADLVNYWQTPKSPNEIKVTPTYMAADGTLKTAAEAVNVTNLLCVMMDWETAGYTVSDYWSGRTPFNVAGGYSNIYWHYVDRWWNDFTENCLVLLLD